MFETMMITSVANKKTLADLGKLIVGRYPSTA